MLLLLMLAVAMLAITLLGVATNYRQRIRRDREVEMIHRGVQYERAVRLYYRKNNSYPPSIDRLLETNKVRFLRKRYKDPMTPDGAWRIAHPTDVLSLTGTNLGLGTSGSPGSTSTGGGSTTTTTAAGQQGGATGGTTGATGGTAGGTTAATDSGQVTGGTITAAAGTGDQNLTSNTGPANTTGGAGEVLGGGPMIGVVSKSSQEGIHTFNDKSKYNEWLFIYLPTQETAQPGHIPNGPFNPKANMTGGIVGGSGLTTTPGTTTSPGTMTPTPTAPTPTPNP